MDREAPGIFRRRRRDLTPLRLGLLHSLSGPMAINERSMVDGEMMAVEEVNAAGGVLGRRIEPVVADGCSEAWMFACEAERLIIEKEVSAIVGCWTSASRRATVPVIEKLDGLLFYPPAYEGLEQSPNVIYTGAAPNQQTTPAVEWLLENRGTRFFLVGSDYVWPRSSAAIIHDHLRDHGGEVVGESYLRFDESDLDPVVEQIADVKPDVIVNILAHCHLEFSNSFSGPVSTRRSRRPSRSPSARGS